MISGDVVVAAGGIDIAGIDVPAGATVTGLLVEVTGLVDSAGCNDNGDVVVAAGGIDTTGVDVPAGATVTGLLVEVTGLEEIAGCNDNGDVVAQRVVMMLPGSMFRPEQR
jgi:hypothetical protein